MDLGQQSLAPTAQEANRRSIAPLRALPTHALNAAGSTPASPKDRWLTRIVHLLEPWRPGITKPSCLFYRKRLCSSPATNRFGAHNRWLIGGSVTTRDRTTVSRGSPKRLRYSTPVLSL